MNIGEEVGEEVRTPLRVLTPDEVEIEINTPYIPQEQPAEDPMYVPNWPAPVEVPVRGG